MKIRKLVICILSCFFIQACTSKEEIKEAKNKEAVEKKIQDYISKREILLKEKSNQVFGIGLNTSYQDFQILLNPSLLNSTSTIYKNDLENSGFDTIGEKFEKVKPLNDFTRSCLFKKSIDTFRSNLLEDNYNYKICVPKPSKPFETYKAEISEKYGVCSLSGTYSFDNEFSYESSMGVSRSSFYGKARNVADILNHKYGFQELQLTPSDPFDQEYSDGTVRGKWTTKDMDILLTGFIYKQNNGKPYEHLKIEYISNNQECHNDVKTSLDKQLTNHNNKLEKERAEQKNRDIQNSSL